MKLCVRSCDFEVENVPREASIAGERRRSEALEDGAFSASLIFQNEPSSKRMRLGKLK